MKIFISEAARRASDGKFAGMKASRERVKKNGGVFDLKGYARGLSRRICGKGSPCPLKVLLYARMGIHRYNFLKGRKFEVIRVKKYVYSTTTPAACYYITLDAKEPSASPQTTIFQTKVSESSVGQFLLSCTIARVRGETSNDRETKATRDYLIMYLPEWPQENPFEKYSPVKEPELEDKDKDWIRLYMQLAVAISDLDWYWRKPNPKDFDDLEFVEVATAEGLDARSATLYIRYKDLYKAQLGQKDDVDRVALVRRRFEEDTGFFSLEGQILSLEQVIPRKPKILANEEDTIIKDQISEAANPTGLPKQISSPLATGEATNQQAINSGDEGSAGELMV